MKHTLTIHLDNDMQLDAFEYAMRSIRSIDLRNEQAREMRARCLEAVRARRSLYAWVGTWVEFRAIGESEWRIGYVYQYAMHPTHNTLMAHVWNQSLGYTGEDAVLRPGVHEWDEIERPARTIPMETTDNDVRGAVDTGGDGPPDGV